MLSPQLQSWLDTFITWLELGLLLALVVVLLTALVLWFQEHGAPSLRRIELSLENRQPELLAPRPSVSNRPRAHLAFQTSRPDIFQAPSPEPFDSRNQRRQLSHRLVESVTHNAP